MREVVLKTYLEAPADKVWEELSKPQLLTFVAHPLMKFEPLEPPEFPARWEQRDYIVSMRFYGIIPVGRQTIRISWPDADGTKRFVRDDGASALIRHWDHLITIEEVDGGTAYTDQVQIAAGLLTPFLALFARGFYAHRQRRWQQLVRAGFDYAP